MNAYWPGVPVSRPSFAVSYPAATRGSSTHFKIGKDNLWSLDRQGDPLYFRQLKISVTLLQYLENVRYLMGPYVPACAFRSWQHNWTLGSSGARSFHMRGRAFDCGDRTYYETVV